MKDQSTEEKQKSERQWPFRINLAHPVDFAGEEISSLEFRRGRVGDLRGMKIDGIPPVDDLIRIASRMCNQPTAALELLAPEDGGAVLEVALDFFGRCLSTGSTR